MLLEVLFRHLFQDCFGSFQELFTALLQDCGRVCGRLQDEGNVADCQVAGGGEENYVPQLLLRPESVEGFLFGATHPELCQDIQLCLVRSNLRDQSSANLVPDTIPSTGHGQPE